MNQSEGQTLRPGDVVRRTRRRAGTRPLDIGDEVIVEHVSNGSVRSTDGGHNYFECIELVRRADSLASAAGTVGGPFQVGDVVKRVVPGINAGYTQGEEFTVTAIRQPDGWVQAPRGPHSLDSALGTHDPSKLELVRRAELPPQPGDTVRRLEYGGTNGTKSPGDEWVVSNRSAAGVYDDRGAWHADDYVELVSRAGEATPAPVEEPAADVNVDPHTLHVGDVIRLTGDMWPAYLLGTEQTITGDTDEFTYARFRADGANWSLYGSWTVSLVRKTGEAPKDDDAEVTFDAYTPAMLPMFTRLADAADAAGHCCEYDAIAAVVGAPDRRTIRELNKPPLVLPERDGLYIYASQTGRVHADIWKRLGQVWYRVRTTDNGQITCEQPTEALVPVVANVPGSDSF